MNKDQFILENKEKIIHVLLRENKEEILLKRKYIRLLKRECKVSNFFKMILLRERDEFKKSIQRRKQLKQMMVN